jgi:tetratricopeptide (TPR) repeat protein
LYRLGASRQHIEIVTLLFPDGTDSLPRLRRPEDQAFALNELAKGYHFRGQPGVAAVFFQRACDIRQSPEIDRDDTRANQYWEGAQRGLSENLYWLSDALRYSGSLWKAESVARRALGFTRQQGERSLEAAALYRLGLVLIIRGMMDDAANALQRSLEIWVDQGHRQEEGRVNAYLAERALYMRHPVARSLADRAWELATELNFEADFIRAARLQGTAAMYFTPSGDFAAADERLHEALRRARTSNLIDEELPTLVALAELYRLRRETKRSRECLDEIWEFAEKGPYPLFQADACNVLAQLERDLDNRDAAVGAAKRALALSWCDGPPFAYHWGLIMARQHLRELGSPEPALPPAFEASKFEPMPNVEIIPENENAT